MRTVLLILLGLSLVICACSSDDDDGTAAPEFTGITITDEMGMVLSEDLDDWRFECPKVDDAVPLEIGAEAFPNPAPISTTVRFPIARASSATIQIWAAPIRSGAAETLVRSLVMRDLPAGVHEVSWDCRDAYGDRVPPGVYRCRLSLQGCTGYGDIEVPALPAVSAAARAFAVQHWTVQRMIDAFLWENGAPARDFYDASQVDELRQWSAAQADEDVLYFAIGHCNQFAFGWDDFVDPRVLPNSGGDDLNELGQAAVSSQREIFRGMQ